MMTLNNSRHELFCQAILEGKNATEAARIAGYSAKTAYSIGSRLLKNVEVTTRINELLAGTANESVLSITQRKELLSKIAMTEFRTKYGINPMPNIAAIAELNKMERVYDTTIKLNDNRSYTFVLPDLSTKHLLQKIIDGEGTVKETPLLEQDTQS